MKGKKKIVKYTYYEVVSVNDKEETLYDLRIWLNKMAGLSLTEKKKTVNGISGRLEELDVIEDDIYALNFMRLDVASDAYKAKEDDKAEHIDLEDDEYIGRNTVALYDAEKHILMIQNNKGSYSVNAIQSYINDTNNVICYLRPIIDYFSIEDCKASKVRKIVARCSDVRQFRSYGSKTFERIIETCNDLEALTIYFEIGMGYEKTTNLNNETVYDVAETLQKNRGCVSNAKVMLSDDQKQGVFDLFNNAKTDTITFIVPQRGELHFDIMSQRMYEVYSTE